MELYERILSKEEINRRFITAVTAIMTNKLISSKTGLAESLGVKPAKFSEILNGRMNVGTDMIARMCDYYEVSPDWLLLSRGNNVFRRMAKQAIWIDDDNLNTEYTEGEMPDSKKPEESKLGGPPIATPISPAEESIIYKMYKDEKEEKERLVKEKESKIDHLQSELRALTAELAAMKAQHSQSQNKESDHHTKISEVIENFTSDSSGDYGEGYPLTKKPTSSKKLSAGKM